MDQQMSGWSDVKVAYKVGLQAESSGNDVRH